MVEAVGQVEMLDPEEREEGEREEREREEREREERLYRRVLLVMRVIVVTMLLLW